MEDIFSMLLEHMGSESSGESPAENEDFAEILESFISGEDNPPKTEKKDDGMTMQNTIHMLLSLMGGDNEPLPEEKVNLMKAMRPYAKGRQDSIDRAITLAETAKKAKGLLAQFGK